MIETAATINAAGARGTNRPRTKSTARPTAPTATVTQLHEPMSPITESSWCSVFPLAFGDTDELRELADRDEEAKSRR